MRYDIVLEVMSGRIFAKFGIAAQGTALIQNTLKLAVCNTGIGLYKSYTYLPISDFSYR